MLAWRRRTCFMSRGAPAAYTSLIYDPGIWLSGTPGRRSAAGTLSNTNHFGLSEESRKQTEEG